MVDEWRSRNGEGKRTRISWVKAHIGIEALNEAADRRAKIGTQWKKPDQKSMVT